MVYIPSTLNGAGSLDACPLHKWMLGFHVSLEDGFSNVQCLQKGQRRLPKLQDQSQVLVRVGGRGGVRAVPLFMGTTSSLQKLHELKSAVGFRLFHPGVLLSSRLPRPSQYPSLGYRTPYSGYISLNRG